MNRHSDSARPSHLRHDFRRDIANVRAMFRAEDNSTQAARDRREIAAARVDPWSAYDYPLNDPRRWEREEKEER